MKTLLIKDLTGTTELYRAALATIHGGFGKGVLAQYGDGYVMPSYPRSEIEFDATQLLSQSQNTQVNNGNDAAFVFGITSTVNPRQSGSNNIRFG